MTQPRSALSVLASFALAMVVLAACGDDDSEPRAQPAQDAPVFVSGDLGEVPVHPLAQPVGEKTNTEGVVAQSFRIRNVDRSQLFTWYEDRLRGWRQEAPPTALGESPNASWRARWTGGDRRLIVTWVPASTLGDASSADDPVHQYSLSLEPVDRPVP